MRVMGLHALAGIRSCKRVAGCRAARLSWLPARPLSPGVATHTRAAGAPRLRWSSWKTLYLKGASWRCGMLTWTQLFCWVRTVVP